MLHCGTLSRLCFLSGLSSRCTAIFRKRIPPRVGFRRPVRRISSWRGCAFGGVAMRRSSILRTSYTQLPASTSRAGERVATQACVLEKDATRLKSTPQGDYYWNIQSLIPLTSPFWASPALGEASSSSFAPLQERLTRGGPFTKFTRQEFSQSRVKLRMAATRVAGLFAGASLLLLAGVLLMERIPHPTAMLGYPAAKPVLFAHGNQYAMYQGVRPRLSLYAPLQVPPTFTFRAPTTVEISAQRLVQLCLECARTDS